MTVDGRIEEAELRYERAVFKGDTSALEPAERGLDGVEADLALARGKIIHARYLGERLEDPRELGLFERAAELYSRLGDERGEGEALFWVGTFHQVVRDDNETALPSLRRARELAARAGDRLTLSYVLRHLGIADHTTGQLDSARAHLEESTRLRRELGFLPGVAANLIGLAFLASQQERREDAAALLAEAAELAEKSEAFGVQGWVAGAREELGLA
ncbi:tetratricopeptide repeat protein [Kitasatospora sp. NPDC051984]|uniref:tetratricopeptide repeat protein n=1 Tax=Kitasatospora sp. NPDC051984 TaxID=3364059 RepID=UPI0037CB8646